MPSRLKKKRAAAVKFDASTGEIKTSPEASVRQVVEVVDDENLPESLDKIKKDAKEIESVVEELEDKTFSSQNDENIEETPIEPSQKSTVESLFSNDTSRAATEITTVRESKRSMGVWVGAMLGMALAIGLSMVFFVRGPSALPFMAAKPTTTPTPTIIPTPTVVTVNRSDIKISVLNGGGIPGEGAKLKAFLEEKGYTVTSVGNASDYTSDTTEIAIKEGQESIGNIVKEDLKNDYSLSVAFGTVDSSEDFDVEVTVGKE